MLELALFHELQKRSLPHVGPFLLQGPGLQEIEDIDGPRRLDHVELVRLDAPHEGGAEKHFERHLVDHEGVVDGVFTSRHVVQTILELEDSVLEAPLVLLGTHVLVLPQPVVVPDGDILHQLVDLLYIAEDLLVEDASAVLRFDHNPGERTYTSHSANVEVLGEVHGEQGLDDVPLQLGRAVGGAEEVLGVGLVLYPLHPGGKKGRYEDRNYDEIARLLAHHPSQVPEHVGHKAVHTITLHSVLVGLVGLWC